MYKLCRFGLGAPPRAQIRGVFVCTFSITEIFTILVEIYWRFSDTYWDFESALVPIHSSQHTRPNVLFPPHSSHRTRAALQGVLESKCTILPSILLSSCWRRLVGQPHEPSDFKPAVRVSHPYSELESRKTRAFPTCHMSRNMQSSQLVEARLANTSRQDLARRSQ